MHIGLIGGIGPAATDFYYRQLIAKAASMQRALDLTMVHADSPTLLDNMAAGNRAAQTDIYVRLTERLKAAGADCVVITSISGHFPIDAFLPVSPLPVVDLMQILRAWLLANGYKKVGLLGTKTVMQSAMHGKLADLSLCIPEGDDLDRVHKAYIDLALSGVPTDQHRDVFFTAGQALVRAQGAEAVLLGGTDLNAAFDGHTPPFQVIDCAAIHVDAIAATL